MFFHPEDRGEMASMIYNWPADEVFIVLITSNTFNTSIITSITRITIIIIEHYSSRLMLWLLRMEAEFLVSEEEIHLL